MEKSFWTWSESWKSSMHVVLKEKSYLTLKMFPLEQTLNKYLVSWIN